MDECKKCDYKEFSIKPIVIDIEKAFDYGEVDNAHAIETIGSFLKSIVETNEITSNYVHIEKFAFKNDAAEDTVCQLQMELVICEAIKRIVNKINIAVENRETANKRMIAVLNEFINR
jgi:hypothetical protein